VEPDSLPSLQKGVGFDGWAEAGVNVLSLRVDSIAFLLPAPARIPLALHSRACRLGDVIPVRARRLGVEIAYFTWAV
jgi:hypothetical protein